MHMLEQHIKLCWPHRHHSADIRHFIKHCIAALRGKGPYGVDIMWVDPEPAPVQLIAPREQVRLLEPVEKNRYHPTTAADLRRAERSRRGGW